MLELDVSADDGRGKEEAREVAVEGRGARFVQRRFGDRAVATEEIEIPGKPGREIGRGLRRAGERRRVEAVLGIALPGRAAGAVDLRRAVGLCDIGLRE